MHKFDPDSPNTPNNLHSFHFGMQTKPLLAIETLISALIPVGIPVELEPTQKFQLSPSKEEAGILLLKEGVFSLCHTENDIVFSTIFAPTVMGLIDAYGSFYDVPARPQHYIYAETRGLGYHVPVDAFLKVADEQNLWHDVARVLAQRLMVMSIREQEYIGTDSYLMVRSLLIELNIYPTEYREQINVLNFVLRRTGLSRSRIMSILAELRKGEYITINRGRLISIDQKLPAVF